MGVTYQFEDETPPEGITYKFEDETPKKKSSSWGDVGLEALINTPSSAANFAKNLITPIIHPVDTINNVKDITFGGINKIIPGAGVGDQEKKFDAVTNFFVDRYGSMEGFKNALAKDPVGIAADASTILTGGGALAARAPGLMGKIGATTKNIGQAIEPLMVAKRAASIPLKVVPKTVSTRLYESAIKPPAPTKRFTREQQAEVIQAGIDEGIMPTQKGINKLEGLVDDLNNYVTNRVKGADVGISNKDIVARLDDLEEFYSNMPDAKGYIKAIDKIKKGQLSKGTNLTVEQAQNVKTTIYSVLKKSYGELADVTKEANKAIARGAKEEIVSIFPELKNINNAESVLLRLEPMIEKAAGRINKRDLMGIGTPIAGQAFSSMGSENLGRAAFIAKAVLDNPSAKAYIAIALNKAKKGGVGNGFVNQRIASYFTGRMNEAQQQ